MAQIETCVERVQGEDYCTVYTGERKFISNLKEMAKDFPNEVKILEENEDGSILAHVPYQAFRFPLVREKRTMTDEQRQAAAERLKAAREKKGKQK